MRFWRYNRKLLDLNDYFFLPNFCISLINKSTLQILTLSSEESLSLFLSRNTFELSNAIFIFYFSIE